jgi:[ribosomal protein S18]-alanine N-acetyltransferase
MSGKNLGETKSGFEVVALEPGDVDAVFCLDQACFSKEVAFPKDLFAFLIKSPDCLCVCIKDRGKLAAFLIAQAVNLHKIQLITIDVSPDYRRKQFAKKLLEFAHNYLGQRGFKRFVLEVAVNNQSAINLYQKMGYKFLKMKKKYYPDGTDAMQMEKVF